MPSALLDRVVNYFHPRRVILFGSHATGQAGPDSDFDLLVILDDDAPPERSPCGPAGSPAKDLTVRPT